MRTHRLVVGLVTAAAMMTMKTAKSSLIIAWCIDVRAADLDRLTTPHQFKPSIVMSSHEDKARTRSQTPLKSYMRGGVGPCVSACPSACVCAGAGACCARPRPRLLCPRLPHPRSLPPPFSPLLPSRPASHPLLSPNSPRCCLLRNLAPISAPQTGGPRSSYRRSTNRSRLKLVDGSSYPRSANRSIT